MSRGAHGRWATGLLMTAAVGVALVLQVTVMPYLAFRGIVPDLCLLVVVAGGLSRGPVFGSVLGFGTGLVLDLAPPADQVAGRWALALLLVGYIAGRVRPDGAMRIPAVVWTVAVASFVGTSVYALTGLVLGDLHAGIPQLLAVVLLAVVIDVVLAPFVVPRLVRLFSVPEAADTGRVMA